MRRSLSGPLVLGLALSLVSGAVLADHRIPDDRPTTAYDDFRERVQEQLGAWIDDPMLPFLEGHGGLAAVSLAEELRYVVPDACYLGSYGAWWGLVPTLFSISAGPDIASKDVAIGRFREELGRAVRLTEADAERCATTARAEIEETLSVSPAHDAVVELEATASLQFVGEGGDPVTALGVVPGQTLLIRVDNTAGFEHSFFIGTENELHAPQATTDVGLDAWSSGTRELEWAVPDDPGGLLFGCTVPGHIDSMHGQIVVRRGVGLRLQT